MAVYYVDSAIGSDANPGTSPALPYATIAKVALVAASGDTIYFSGIFRLSSGVTFTNLSGVSYLQTPSRPPADIRWETIVGTGWTVLGGNRYSKLIAGGLGSGGGSSAMNGEVLFDWKTTADSLGRPTGHLQYVAGAGSINTYDYNNATGLLTVNISSNPNTATSNSGFVSYSVGSAAQSISLEGGASNIINGLVFSLACASSSSYSLFLHNQQNTRVVNCTFYDARWHHAGYLNHTASLTPATNNTFETCTFYGGASGLGHSVHYAQSSTVAATGALWLNCTFYGHRYLDPTGAVMAGQASMNQVASMAHGDAGVCINDILSDGSTYIECEPGWGPMEIQQQPVTAATWTWDSCPARMDRCTVRGGGSQTGASLWRTANSLAHRRFRYDFRNLGPSGLAGVGGAGGIVLDTTPSGAVGFHLFEAGEFIINGRDDANDTRIIATYGFAGNELRFLNCSFHEISTGHTTKKRLLFSPGFRTDVFLRFRGCAIAYGESYSGNELFGEDSSMNAAHHDMLDCAYYNVTVFSENTAFDTQAEWTTLVDTQASVETTAMFPLSPTSLDLTSVSSLWNVLRKTFSVRPAAGINGDYFGLYGAWQYPSSTELDVPSLAENMMRDTCAILRPTLSQSAVSAEVVTTWTVVAYNLKCAVQSIRTGESETLGRDYPYYAFDVYLPPNADITYQDRLAFISGPAGLDERTLEVRSFPIDDSGMQPYIRVQCEEVKGNA